MNIGPYTNYLVTLRTHHATDVMSGVCQLGWCFEVEGMWNVCLPTDAGP